MAKYEPGQTSKENLETKKNITSSLFNKSNLLKKIYCKDDIYSTLILKNDNLSLSAALRWEDHSLDIVKCSWNTAHAEHNRIALKSLLDAISLMNTNLRTVQNSSPIKNRSRRNHISIEKLKLLEDENFILRNTLAEVYRAYIHTLEDIKDSKGVNETIQHILKSQSNLLGTLLVRQVK